MPRTSFKFQNQPKILGSGSVGGKLEKEGPLGTYFDITAEDTKFNATSWEKAESEMARIATEFALHSASLGESDIDAIFAGDLMNQCTASSFGLKTMKVPYFGLYGACSTFALSLGLGGMAVNSGFCEKTICTASSHFCSAERQYRFPIEYGNQRTPTSQTTVTGCGAVILGQSGENKPVVSEFMPGFIQDLKIDDVNNMGAAMAPAAFDTIHRYFLLSEKRPDDFSLILTGDLGGEGKEILLDLCDAASLPLGENYNDCGLMIYDQNKQDVHAGGSGCGCSASVFCGYIMKLFEENEHFDVLLIGTGALLSPTTALQKESIPGIAHLVRITK